MQCLILAGGLGSRMRPWTEAVPKALLPVAGRSFADWQLDWLAAGGVDRVVYSVGHLGDAIEDHVGDGRRWGVDVRYVKEGAVLRGTAGAIRLAAEHGVLDDTFFVLYGDSYLCVDPRAVAAAFVAAGRPALMTVYHNRGSWDTSNVRYRDGVVELYDKAGTGPDQLEYIDYGLMILARRVIEEALEPGASGDLAPVLHSLSRRRQLAGFEVTQRFFEIGSPGGLTELEHYLRARGDPPGPSS